MFPMKAVNENRFSHIKNYQETASPLTVCMYVCGMWCVVVVVCVCVMCMYVILSMTLCVCVHYGTSQKVHAFHNGYHHNQLCTIATFDNNRLNS